MYIILAGCRPISMPLNVYDYEPVGLLHAPLEEWREGEVAFLDICTVYYMVERGFNPSRLTGGGVKIAPISV